MIHYIYKHTNKINGKSYIGQTKNIKMRWRPEGYKYCRKFYHAILKYGWDNFTHEILRECDETDVDFWEIYYIGFYDTINNGYNLEGGGCANKTVSAETRALISKAGMGRPSCLKGKPAWNKGLKTPEEVRKKLSESHKGKRQPLSEETKRKIGQAQIGKKVSEETRKKLSISHMGKPSARKGKKLTDEQKKFLSKSLMGKSPWNKGKNMSDETKSKLSKAKKGVYYTTSRKVKNIDTGEIYMCAREASNKTGINYTNIYAVCSGKRPKAGGYRWEYFKEDKTE